MIDLAIIQGYFKSDAVFVTEHAMERFKQRGIRMRDVRAVVMSGQIIEQYPDDFPFPSCLITGTTKDNRVLHVVMSDEGSSSRIITAYYPDPAHWSSDFKTRL
jgi:hypothetical protein